MTQGPLDYRGAEPPETQRNTWPKMLGRAALGCCAAVASSFAGIWLAGVTGVPWLFGVPPLVVLGVLLYVAIGLRHFGYVTGFVLGPFIIVTGLFILLMMICGVGAMRP